MFLYFEVREKMVGCIYTCEEEKKKGNIEGGAWWRQREISTSLKTQAMTMLATC